MTLLQIPQAPNIPPMHQSQQMQRAHSLPIPIQIRQHQESILRTMPGIPHNDILLLRPPFQDIEYPVEPALLALGLHVRSDMLLVYLWSLGYHAYLLIGVFFDVLRCARPDKVEFQVLV